MLGWKTFGYLKHLLGYQLIGRCRPGPLMRLLDDTVMRLKYPPPPPPPPPPPYWPSYLYFSYCQA